MRPVCVPVVCLLIAIIHEPAIGEAGKPVFRVEVELAEFTFSVAGGDGKYITGLRPDQVSVLEDGKEQEIVSFWETRTHGRPEPYGAVFVLLDTSNRM